MSNQSLTNQVAEFTGAFLAGMSRGNSTYIHMLANVVAVAETVVIKAVSIPTNAAIRHIATRTTSPKLIETHNSLRKGFKDGSEVVDALQDVSSDLSKTFDFKAAMSRI